MWTSGTLYEILGFAICVMILGPFGAVVWFFIPFCLLAGDNTTSVDEEVTDDDTAQSPPQLPPELVACGIRRIRTGPLQRPLE